MRCLGLVVMAGDFWGAGAAMVEGRQPRQGAAKARGGRGGGGQLPHQESSEGLQADCPVLNKKALTVPGSGLPMESIL